MYPGAGLLALLFALVIPSVVSIPIPLNSQSELSFPSPIAGNEQDLIHHRSVHSQPQTLLTNRDGPISAASTEALADDNVR